MPSTEGTPVIRTVKLARLKRDFGYFVRAVFRRKLEPYQRDVFEDDHKTTVYVGGRGVGKSTVGQMFGCWQCIRQPGHVVVWVSSVEEQSEHSQDILRGFVAGTALEADVVEISWKRVKFRNGSIIYYLPNSPKRARGFHRRWVRDGETPPGLTLVIDEASEVHEQVYIAALGVLTGDNQRAIFMGSAWSKNSWFYREYERGLEPGGSSKSFTVSAEDVPDHIVDKVALEERKETLEPEHYMAEYCAVFMDALSSFFTRPQIEKATREYEFPAAYDPEYEFCLGVDLSSSARWGSDFTVLTVLGWHPGREGDTLTNLATGHTRFRELPEDEKVPPHVRVFDIRRFQLLDNAGLLRELSDIKARYPGLEHGICESYESMQLDAIVYSVHRRGEDEQRKPRRYGRGPVEIQMHVVTPTNPLVLTSANNLHRLIREGELWLPASGARPAALDDPQGRGDVCRTLRLELLNLQKEISDAGNIRFVAGKGFKKDAFSSLAWGAWQLMRQTREPGGEWGRPRTRPDFYHQTM